MPAKPGTEVSLSAQGVGDCRVGDEGSPEVAQGWGRLQEGQHPNWRGGVESSLKGGVSDEISSSF